MPMTASRGAFSFLFRHSGLAGYLGCAEDLSSLGCIKHGGRIAWVRGSG